MLNLAENREDWAWVVRNMGKYAPFVVRIAEGRWGEEENPPEKRYKEKKVRERLKN